MQISFIHNMNRENSVSSESSEENTEEEDDDGGDDDEEEEIETVIPVGRSQQVILDSKTIYNTINSSQDSEARSLPLTAFGNLSNLEINSREMLQSKESIQFRLKDEPGLSLSVDPEDELLATLQTAVRDTYLAFKGNSQKKKVWSQFLYFLWHV